MTTNSTPAPLVTRAALDAFTQRLVDQFAPEKVILFGSQARGDARLDSDADILVVMPYEGRPPPSGKLSPVLLTTRGLKEMTSAALQRGCQS